MVAHRLSLLLPMAQLYLEADEINSKERVRANLEASKSDLFDEAQNEVFTLLIVGVFNRFVEIKQREFEATKAAADKRAVSSSFLFQSSGES